MVKNFKKVLLEGWIYLRFQKALKQNDLTLKPEQRAKLKELIKEVVSNER